MAQPMFSKTREEIRREFVPFSEIPTQALNPPKSIGFKPAAKAPAFNPLQSGFHLEQRGGMDTQEVRTKGVTPIGKFAVILLLFALAVLFLPKGVRGWFALIIVMGALASNPGAIEEFRGWVGV